MPRKAAKPKPGKYDSVIHKLQRLDLVDETSEDKIKEAVAALRSRPLSEIAKQYKALRLREAQLKAQLSALNVDLSACVRVLVESQEQGAEGWGQYGAPKTTLRLVTGESISIYSEPYTTTEDPEVLRQFFVTEGLDSLLTPNANRVNAMNKERLLAGKEGLPGTKVWYRPKVVFADVQPEVQKPLRDNDPFADLFN